MFAKRNPLRAMQQVRSGLGTRDLVLTDQFEQLIEAAVLAGWRPPKAVHRRSVRGGHRLSSNVFAA